MARYTKKEVMCDKCYSCIHDCKQQEPIEICENFVKGYNRHEYIQMIRDENVDLKKLCNKHGLSYNYMMKMLDGKIHMKHKYRMVLNSRLGELEEYLPYVDKFNSGFAYE